ncbi:ThuA domain-containing protein [Pareuzebyella sediminis]|uniref:ThuA domain-containing protein n=1 Tax=Pareuzebyella sediminis TaxID=2607998 RepID=UPI001E5A9F14|nr:ThuA domain-containing protein [Pareuzebyella sediminis]
MNIRAYFLSAAALILIVSGANAQGLEEFKITPEWTSKIESFAPKTIRVKAPVRKIMMFSQHTGFYHWTIPHNIEMFKILAQTTGGFEITNFRDISAFDKETLKKFDAVVFNNCNPSGPKRDLFYDLLSINTSLDETDITQAAQQYEKNFMDYIEGGGGLMILHGAITVQNNSMPFSKLTGGSFDYHPKQQRMHVKEVDSEHPLVQAFDGNGFTHVDEPYFFKNAYFEYDFHPLLYIDTGTLEGTKEKPKSPITYVSWIKRYGKGRVFYTSPSHNAQIMENPEFLQFIVDGLQYVTGDLKADDSPLPASKRPN